MALFDFKPRKIINGNYLARCQNEDVSILVNITGASGPKQLTAKSTDNVDVRVITANDEASSSRGWVEVIGQPIGPGAIRASEVIPFESAADAEEFDTDSHNMLVQILNNKPADELYGL